MGPIAVFDSGVGGLSVLRELVAQMPSAPAMSLMDVPRYPLRANSVSAVSRIRSFVLSTVIPPLR